MEVAMGGLSHRLFLRSLLGAGTEHQDPGCHHQATTLFAAVAPNLWPTGSPCKAHAKHSNASNVTGQERSQSRKVLLRSTVRYQ